MLSPDDLQLQLWALIKHFWVPQSNRSHCILLGWEPEQGSTRTKPGPSLGHNQARWVPLTETSSPPR